MPLTIPTPRPRIWFTSQALLDRGLLWWTASGNRSPSTATQFAGGWDWGLMYLFGSPAQKSQALATLVSLLFSETPPYGWLVQFAGQGTPNTSSWVPVGPLAAQLSPGNVTVDQVRVQDWVPAVVDWIWSDLTPVERLKFIGGWQTTLGGQQVSVPGFNQLLQIEMAKSWGGLTQPASNYFWGYWRAEVLYALATYYEDPGAAAILNHAIGPAPSRWEAFRAWANRDGRGGAPVEGSEYGRAMLQYPVVPLASLAAAGRDLTQETSWFAEAAGWLIASTSPRPELGDQGQSYFQVPPCGDLERSAGFPAEQAYGSLGDVGHAYYYGDFMNWVATEFPQPLAGEASFWLNQVRPPMSSWAAARAMPSAAPVPIVFMDFQATGGGHAVVRSDASPAATMVHLQVGQPTGGSHQHHDQGNFEISRNGQVLAKEQGGYAVRYAGLNGVGTVPCDAAACHNCLLIGGVGPQAPIDYRTAAPKFDVFEGFANIVHARSDLTGVYVTTRPSVYPTKAQKVVRDFVFVRSLETLVVLDWMQLADPAVPSTFLVCSPLPWVIDLNLAQSVASGRDQVLSVKTILPSAPSIRSVNTSANVSSLQSPWWYGQRLEITDAGGAATRLGLNVLQARAPGDPDLQINMVKAASLQVWLDHPIKGSVLLILPAETTGPYLPMEVVNVPQEVFIEGLPAGQAVQYRLDGGPVQSASTTPAGTLDLPNLPPSSLLQIAVAGQLLPSLNRDADTLLASALGVPVALIDSVIVAGRPWATPAQALQALANAVAAASVSLWSTEVQL